MIPIIILVGIVGLIVAAGSPRERSYAALPPGPSPRPTVPSPIATLDQYARAGHMPPLQVVVCAIAEAQMLGRNDVAHVIAQQYRVPPEALGQHASPPAPPPMPAPAPPPAMPVPMPAIATAPVYAPEQAAAGATHASDIEIQAMLDRHPHAFVSGHTVAEPAPRRAPPIAGVADDAWDGLCTRLEREAPTYESSRHVGRFRQRRERLLELGINPDHVVGSPDAQQDALDAELADAHEHIVNSPLAESIGAQVVVPGYTDPMLVTMSGVLGLAQVAGLEGAASWLENQKDRRRFPHTTNAFVKTNGMF